MCCVQYENYVMPCSLGGFISFMVDAYAQAYCLHVKRTNTVVLLSATLPFTIKIYLSPWVWGGEGEAGSVPFTLCQVL